MKKILHLQLLPLLSGVQRVSLNEIQEILQEFSHDIEYQMACSSFGPLTKKLDEIGVVTHVIPTLKREISPYNDIVSIYHIYKLVRREKYDVVHTHSSKTGFVGRIASKLAGSKKIIHTVHGFSFPAANSFSAKLCFFIMEWLAKFFTDQLIVLNNADREIAIYKLGYNNKAVKVVPNGVDVDLFSPADKTSNEFRIVMVGRLWKQKNPMCLLRAFKKVVEIDSSITLDFVGDGDLRHEMLSFIENNNLSRNVKIVGWKDDVFNLLNSYDLFVLPSLWEGMPLAILEAQSCGLPTVVSDIAGNRDLVTDGFNGLLFETNNDDILFEAMKRLYLDRNELKRFSNNARNNVLQNFSNKKRNLDVMSIYLS
ncbi:glycosyltransferase family 4 protein [Agarivorans sp. QJM3NY_25]|uniref:glycosyltransferase family 4 protein n=1 Tax=Agarivorans sp. QJM3NY_25 TaxID=3421430 RepID=UPI003D7E0858